MAEDTRHSKILVIEDDEDNVHLLELFFETSGFTNVHVTSDARTVEGLVRELAPELILLDLHMPHVDGFEVMRRIQQAIPEHEIPMVVMSGDISPESWKTATELGATDFLAKPYAIGTLLQKVEQALGASKTDAQHAGE